MKFQSSTLVILGVAWGAVACVGGRDVEVSGKVTAPEGVTVGDALIVDFIDTLPEGSVDETPSRHRRMLHAVGAFKETVRLEADQVALWGLDDRDGDGHCTQGELWGRVPVAPIENNRATGVTLTLLAQPCPPLDE